MLVIQLNDHVGKHCQPKELLTQERDDGTLEAVGVAGNAFFPDEDGVSVGWVEHIHHDNLPHADRLSKLIGCMGVRTIRKSHRLAVLKVGSIVDCGTRIGKTVSVVPDPQPNFDCHSLIVGIEPSAADLQALIAAEIIAMEVMLT